MATHTLDDLYTRLLCLLGIHEWALSGTFPERGSIYGLDRCSGCGAHCRGSRFLRREADGETKAERELREDAEARQATRDACSQAASAKDAPITVPRRQLRRVTRQRRHGPRLPENPSLRPQVLPERVRDQAQRVISHRGTGPEVTDLVLASTIRDQPIKPRSWAAPNPFGRTNAQGLRGPHAPPPEKAGGQPCAASGSNSPAAS